MWRFTFSDFWKLLLKLLVLLKMGGLEQSVEKTGIVEGKSCTAFVGHGKDSVLVPEHSLLQ